VVVQAVIDQQVQELQMFMVSLEDQGAVDLIMVLEEHHVIKQEVEILHQLVHHKEIMVEHISEVVAVVLWQ
jgi:hypothetical protein